MIAEIDMGTATVIAALIAIVPTTLALWIRKSVSQINRAVNHVDKGEPTLIERVRKAEKENKEFRDWVISALVALGAQVGSKLPEPPPSLKE